MDWIEHRNALLVDHGIAKRLQYTQMALSADESTAKKQELIHCCLGHPGEKCFNNCIKWMGMSDLQLEKGDKLLEDKCEVCIKVKKAKGQSHVPVS